MSESDSSDFDLSEHKRVHKYELPVPVFPPEEDYPILDYLKREGLLEDLYRKKPLFKVPRLQAFCVKKIGSNLSQLDVKEVWMAAEALQLNELCDQVHRFLIQEHNTKQASSALRHVIETCPSHMKSLLYLVAEIGPFHEDDEEYARVQLVKTVFDPDSLPSSGMVVGPANAWWNNLKRRWGPVYAAPTLTNICTKKLVHGMDHNMFKMVAWIVASIAKGKEEETVKGLEEFKALLSSWKSEAIDDFVADERGDGMIEVCEFAANVLSDARILRSFCCYIERSESKKLRLGYGQSGKRKRRDEYTDDFYYQRNYYRRRTNMPLYWELKFH